MKRPTWITGVAILAFCLLMLCWGCGNNGSNSTNNTYSVSSTVTGLGGTLVLQINGGSDLTITTNGRFTFGASLTNGAAYNVIISNQPSGQSCTVANASGTINHANVTNVQVTCANNTYTVGGAVTGLGGTLALQNNGGDDLTVTTNGSFAFGTALTDGSAYSITVSGQPSGQTCTVTNSSGTINAANVSNVQVACTDNTYTVGGRVTGLTGTLILQNNGGDDLTVTASGPFAFDTVLTNGEDYSVTISNHPSGQTCTVANGSGTINAANVTDVQVACPDTVRIGYFMDGPVEGVEYSTATQSGFTDSEGTFQYISGEIVSFYVGDILVGQANGAPEITPFDLAGIMPPQTNLEIVRTMNEVDRSNYGTPFEVAVNIAIFLQTLDEDGIYSNGIQIPPQMHSLAMGAEIDFNQKMFEFPNNFKFRQLVISARSAGLWGGTRAIRKTGYALNTLYEGLGIVPEIHVNTVREDDDNADGTVDSRNTFTYDANGNLTMDELDSDADGTVDSRNTSTYDVNGNLTMEEYDSDANGTVDYRYTYTYDANGNFTMDELDLDVDGTVDDRFTYTYDADGNLIMEEYDSDADGTVDSRYTSTYDVDGNRIMDENDSDADGNVDSRYTYTYDVNGNLTLREVDLGPAEMRDIHTYDANNNLIMLEYDLFADGIVDQRFTYTYDANNNLTTEEIDDDADGTVDDRHTYSYDINGNRIMGEYDDNADGTVNSRDTYTYDADGNRIMQEHDANGLGITDERVHYFYQAGGGFMYYEDDPHRITRFILRY